MNHRIFHCKLFNKQFPIQVVQISAFLGRSILKQNPERVVEIPEPMCLVQKLKGGFNGAKIGFLSPIVRELFGY